MWEEIKANRKLSSLELNEAVLTSAFILHVEGIEDTELTYYIEDIEKNLIII